MRNKLPLFCILFSVILKAQTFQWARNPGTSWAHRMSCDNIGRVYTSGGISNQIGVARINSNGTLLWSFILGNSSTSYGGYDVSHDALKNVYVTGVFNGSCDFNPGAGVNTLSTAGGNDIFVAKYDSLGNYVWAFRIGGGSYDEGNTILSDPSGNVYISGKIGSGTIDFDPGAGTANLNCGGAYFAKYNSAGQYQWAYCFGSAEGWNLCFDASGNICMFGNAGVGTDMDPGAGSAPVVGSGFNNATFAKYTPAGTYVSHFSIAGTNGSVGEWYGVSVDPSDNVYLTGSFNSTSVDFDPSAATATLATSGGDDAYVAKYNSSYQYQWSFKIGGALTDFGYEIATDATGEVYVSGSYASSGIDFNPGAGTYTLGYGGSPSDAYVASYTTNGVFKWAFQIGNSGYEEGTGICLDNSSGSVLVSGHYGTANVDFDPSAATATIGGVSGYNAFVAKYSQCGVLSQPGSITGITTMCAGSGNTTYSISAVGGATSYSWALPGGWTGTSSTNTISAAPGTSGLISVTANNLCGPSTPQTLSVTVNPLPAQPSAINGPSVLCPNPGATIYSVSPVAGATSYAWSLPGTWSGSSSTNTITAFPPSSGGLVSVAATNACGTGTAAVLNVTVYASPTINAASTTTLLCVGQSATLTVGGSSITYTWMPGAIAANSIVVSPTVTSTYTVSGTAATTCTNVTTFTQPVSTCVGIDQPEVQNSDFVVAPNPTNGRITVITDNNSKTIIVFNSLGSIVYKTEIKEEKTVISLDKEPAGIYFIKVGAITKKIIKE